LMGPRRRPSAMLITSRMRKSEILTI